MFAESEVGLTANFVRGCLIVTLPADLGALAPGALHEAVFSGLEGRPAGALIFECSGLRFMDLVEFGELRLIAGMAGLRGIRTFLVELSPWIAAYLAEKNVDLAGIEPLRGLEDALGFAHDPVRR